MLEAVPATPGISRRLFWLDGLSRAAATLVMAVLLFTVVSSSLFLSLPQATRLDPMPTVRPVPSPLKKPWLWVRPALNFEAMYPSGVD